MHTAHKQRIVQNFGDAQNSYDAHAQVQKCAASRLSAFLPDLTAPRVLEIGCGTGFLTAHLVRTWPSAELIITDLAAPMVAQCARKFSGPNRHFSVMDGENLNVAGKFDLIVSNMAFQWFENLPAALEKLKTFLNPGGQILFSTLGTQTFQEWHMVLKQIGAAPGFTAVPNCYDILDQETHHIAHNSGMDFLQSLKNIGAHTPQKNYTPLSVPKLNRALALFEQKYNSTITYEVVYAALSASNESESCNPV